MTRELENHVWNTVKVQDSYNMLNKFKYLAEWTEANAKNNMNSVKYNGSGDVFFMMHTV